MNNNNNLIELLDYFKKINIDCKINPKHINSNDYINGVSSIINANQKQITFYEDKKFEIDLKYTKAKACFIKDSDIYLLPKECIPIVVLNPYLCFAHSTNFFNPVRKSNGQISKLSHIYQKIDILKNVEIGHFSVISNESNISKNVIIENNVNIGKSVSIGANTFIGNNCVKIVI